MGCESAEDNFSVDCHPYARTSQTKTTPSLKEVVFLDAKMQPSTTKDAKPAKPETDTVLKASEFSKLASIDDRYRLGAM